MNNLSQQYIAIKKLGALVVRAGNEDNLPLAMSFQADVMSLGFIFSDELVAVIRTLSNADAEKLYEETIAALKQLKGANVKHSPMYPNFPAQVMEASDAELFVNAIVHYWTGGHWTPDYEVLPRKFEFEATKFQPIKLASTDDFKNILPMILSSADSISDEDKTIVRAFFDKTAKPRLPAEIPFKENLCLVAGILFEKGNTNYQVFRQFVKTTTDVLRVATFVSGGDISLAENTRFKSFTRKQRRLFVALLNDVIREEDVIRHRGKWVRLFHSLHVGEFGGRAREVAHKIRNNEKIETFNGQVEDAIRRQSVTDAVALLTDRPGDFARRISHLLRITSRKDFVIDAFLNVAADVPTRNLLQLLGHVNTRHEDVAKRVVFPKGNAQKAHIVRAELPKMDQKSLTTLREGIRNTLITRFGDMENMGRVWIDPELRDCPLPTQLRSASEGLFTVARGTKLPIGDNNVLRLFIYWKGHDVDLSATFHNEDLEMVDQISYTHLKSGELKAWHSGDITSAPRGASEFIDVDIAGALKAGVRYVAMNVLSYSQIAFAEMDTCFAGWMTREKPESNEIYEPKTVQQKIDLRASSKNAMPVVFDLQERKAIWVDLTTNMSTRRFGNNVESNRATIIETVEAIRDSANKVSLYELLDLHARARGELVNAREDAEVTFGFDQETDITPYNVSQINSEFVA